MRIPWGRNNDNRPDLAVEETREQRADFDRQIDEVREGRAEVAERRREAADLLAQSLEAERRNHFAEAIVSSMRRSA